MLINLIWFDLIWFELHWLTVLVYKALNGLSPRYVAHECQLTTAAGRRWLRSSNVATYEIARTRTSLGDRPFTVYQTLIVSLVLTRLDYGNATLAGISAAVLNRLQSVLNAAARSIAGLRRSDRITVTLASLQWSWFAFVCYQGRRNRGGGCPRCPCCTGAHGGREMPFSARQFTIAFASKQCNTQTTNKRGVGERGAPKSLWKSTNSEEYTFDSLSDWLSVIDEHLMSTSLYEWMNE